jgi:hypothetical protein
MYKKYVIGMYIGLACVAEASMPQTYQAETSISYERWKLPGGEKLGMAKIGLIYDIAPWWYGGVDLFGAASGERGGFFTFGFDSGLQTDPEYPVQLRGGIFVGAGGGGGAPQGGGLMLRPYAELRYHFEDFTMGAGVSHVRFPNGDIRSTQVYGSVSMPWSGKFWHGWPPYAKGALTQNHPSDGIEMETILKAGRYLVSDSVKNTRGAPQKDMDWMGMEIRRLFPNGFFGTISSAGAGGGDADGYMEVFGGAGYRLQISDWPVFASLQGDLGLGGGGAVDTGGGTMWKVGGGIETHLTDHLVLGVEAAHVQSFEGEFKANSLGAYLGLRGIWDGNSPAYSPTYFAVRAIEKTHFTGHGDFKDPFRNDRIDMLGMAVDHYFNPYIYMTGQALWAYNGNSGGYTEGLLGMGIQTPSWHRLRFWSEATIGAGGGGGVDTDGGLLASLGIGGTFRLTDRLDLQLGTGYTRSKSGGFSSVDGTFQLRYRFSFPFLY